MAKITTAGQYFCATVFQGKLHLRGIAAWAPWEPERFLYMDEHALDLRLIAYPDERKVQTRPNLEAEVAKSVGAPDRLRTLWIHNALERDAREFWFNLLTAGPDPPPSTP